MDFRTVLKGRGYNHSYITLNVAQLCGQTFPQQKSLIEVNDKLTIQLFTRVLHNTDNTPSIPTNVRKSYYYHAMIRPDKQHCFIFDTLLLNVK